MGKTLFRKEDKQGNAFYEVLLTKHKRDASGKPRHYRLPDVITPDLDIWLFKWRPNAQRAVETIENWKTFWGYGGGRIDRLRERIQSAHQGVLPDKVKVCPSEYIQRESKRLTGAEGRISAWAQARDNLQSHDRVFFILGKHKPESFGKIHYVASIWRLVNRAIAESSLTLFGEAKWLNPHALRNISEKHIRVNGKAHIAEPFGAFIGHTKAAGDEYAAQIMTEYEITQDIVDDWWE
jgi:hypothetical protein